MNYDVLSGDVWSREDKLSLRDRSLVTAVSLMAQHRIAGSATLQLKFPVITVETSD